MSGFAKRGSSQAGNLVAAPKTLRYEHDGGLPVAIEAKSNRRTCETYYDCDTPYDHVVVRQARSNGPRLSA